MRTYHVKSWPKIQGIQEARVQILREEPAPGQVRQNLTLDTPERVADFMLSTLARQEQEGLHDWDREHAFVLMLSTRRILQAWQRLSIGTLDTLLLHPRDVFRLACIANAAAVLILHTHPSGDPTPSESDIRVTRELVRGGQLLRIDVLDHVILGAPTQVPPGTRGWTSLKELGYFSY